MEKEYRRKTFSSHELDSPRSRSYQSNRKVSQVSGISESRSSSSTAHSKGGNSFKEFLWQHIEMALGRGFDDNVGRNPVTSLFEVCIVIGRVTCTILSAPVHYALIKLANFYIWPYCRIIVVCWGPLPLNSHKRITNWNIVTQQFSCP